MKQIKNGQKSWESIQAQLLLALSLVVLLVSWSTLLVVFTLGLLLTICVQFAQTLKTHSQSTWSVLVFLTKYLWSRIQLWFLVFQWQLPWVRYAQQKWALWSSYACGRYTKTAGVNTSRLSQCTTKIVSFYR